jgi:hypothetical protein
VGAHGRITFTIQVHSRYRTREEARELEEWLNSSLEGILVEEGLWETGTGSSVPDIQKDNRGTGRSAGRESSTGGWGHDDTHANGCGISQ